MKPFWLGAVLGMAAGALIVLATRSSSSPSIDGERHTMHEPAIETRLGEIKVGVRTLSMRLRRIEEEKGLSPAGPGQTQPGSSPAGAAPTSPTDAKRVGQVKPKNDLLLHDMTFGIQNHLAAFSAGGEEWPKVTDAETALSNLLSKRYRFRTLRSILKEFGEPDKVEVGGGEMALRYDIPASKQWLVSVSMTFSNGVLASVRVSEDPR